MNPSLPLDVALVGATYGSPNCDPALDLAAPNAASLLSAYERSRADADRDADLLSRGRHGHDHDGRDAHARDRRRARRGSCPGVPTSARGWPSCVTSATTPP